MEFFEVIEKRKAVRKFIAGKKIPKEKIEEILEIINLAPSAKNLQSYKIFIAEKSDAIEKISQACYSQKEGFIRNASLIFVFCIDPKIASDYFGERGKLFSIQDAAIAATYTVLATANLGYASCRVGNFDDSKMQEVLKTKLTPVAAIIIGHPKEDPERHPRKLPEELVEYL